MKTIAYVEENADNRLLVSAILAGHYELREYETGPEALEAFRDEPPDLALLDISLPGMDGTEILERMRDDERTADVSAIALTAHAMEGDREKYLAAGFDDYVSKPIVDEKILLDAIRGLLEEC